MQSRPFSSRRGFTLVEIMVVVLIISILCTAAVPAFGLLKSRARTTAIVNDFRVFAAAFDTYAHEAGNWPTDTAAGVVPPEMAGRIDSAAWSRKTPMGGQYNFENNQMHFGTRYRACIVISATAAAPLPLNVEALLDIDQAIDDGNLLNGNFRVGTGIVPLFVVQR
jgi:prepilin-type N-terminal cleavage/methylation domain-containing protein